MNINGCIKKQKSCGINLWDEVKENNLLLRHKAAVRFSINAWLMTVALSFTSAHTFMRQRRRG